VADESDRWLARVGAALCAASRWTSVASVVLMILGAMFGFVAGWQGAAAATFILVCGAAQIYLAVRIDFDRRVFGAVETNYAGFDAALKELGLRLPQSRPANERVAGTLRLVRATGWLFAAQLAALIAIVWWVR
jgi:hypothetical protein